jgi:Raf kinase inhibitor-like YbhB/YbcL family protein
MKLTSDSFVDGGTIDPQYAFARIDAKTRITLSSNRNPQLAWSDVPDGTRSFALICLDHDVPSTADDVNQEGRVVSADLPRVQFYHWVLFDIPATTRSIGAGDFSKEVTPRGKAGPMVAHSPLPGVVQGINNYTDWFASDHDMSGDYYGYDGPCPPWNDEIAHHYAFTVYALAVDRLEVHGRVTGDAVKAAMAGRILAEASITGVYSRNPQVASGA